MHRKSHIVHRRHRWPQQRDSELKGKNDAAWHRKKAIEQTFYGLLVRMKGLEPI